MQNLTSSDFFGPEFKQNPYPYYAQLTANAPVYRFDMPSGAGWLITRYDLVLQVLKDYAHFTRDMRKVLPTRERMSLNMANPMDSIMLNFDPPDHTRLRALVSKGFTPRLIETLRPRIQELSDQFIEAVQAHGQMDLIEDFALPLPIIVISELLGVPVEDRDKFRQWSSIIISASGNLQGSETVNRAFSEFVAYLDSLFERRRTEPADDLLTALLQAEIDGEMLQTHELYAMVMLLLIAGHETTVNLIGNGMLALMQHPDQMKKLQDDPTLIKLAVEELLRYDGPVEWATPRWATEPITLEGQPIGRGDIIFIILAAADHDPAQFTMPDELDIARERSNHLAFGMGVHYCLGAPLARLEGQIAINTLLARLPNIHLAAAPETLTWRPGFIVRGLHTLPVMF